MRTDRSRVADYIIRRVAGLGVDHVFGVGGANIEDLYDAAHHSPLPIRAVVAKHEYAAVCMAEGSRRTTGRLGVAMATSGAGAMNLVPGIAEAYAARVPLLALVGQPPRDLAGRGAFQDSSGRCGAFDAVELFSAITLFCARVDDPGDTEKLLTAAIDAACAPRGGPAVLLLPKDVQQATIPGQPSEEPLPSEVVPAAAGRGAVADLLGAAAARGDGILLIAGDGVGHHDARAELADLAHRLGAAVAVTPEGKDAFDNHHPCFAGVTGAIGHPTVLRRLEAAAVCVLVGTRLAVMARAGLDAAFAGTRLVSFDPEPPFVTAAPDEPAVLHVEGDLRRELRAMNDLLAWLPHRPAPPAGPPEHLVTPGPGTPGVRLADAVRAIEAALPDDATVVSDAGNASAAAVHYLATPRRGRFIIAMGMGGMGHSFGAGIGAAFATGRRTCVLSGDGGFYAHGMEVHTAVEYDLPITFVIFNNNAHAMCATREQLFYGGTYTYSMFKPADIAAGARAMFPSLTAVRATTVDELRLALAEANAGPGPALVCVEADPDDMPPFVPFLRLLDAPSTSPGATHVDSVTPVG